MNIITNHQPRDIIYAHELTEEERKEFDYFDWDSEVHLAEGQFVRYKGELIDLHDVMAVRAIGSPDEFKAWDGYRDDSFFSGILIKYTEDFEQVIMGRYYT